MPSPRSALQRYIDSQQGPAEYNRQRSVMSRPSTGLWQPEYEKEPPLEPPMISPDDLIGSGIPTKIAMMLKGSAPLLGGLGIIRNSGGQWLTSRGADPARSVKNLHISERGGGDPASLVDKLKAHLATRPDLLPGDVVREMFDKTIAYLEPKAALNQWNNTTMLKYIKERMGSPNDEIGQGARRGVLHVNPDELYGQGLPNYIGTRREKMGFDPKGTFGNADLGPVSHLGKAWEDAVDSQIRTKTAGSAASEMAHGRGHPVGGEPVYPDDLPWLAKTPPDAPVHELFNGIEMPSDLGLNMLTATLHNRMKEGKLKPHQLNKVTISDAVDWANEARVAEIAKQTAARQMEQVKTHTDLGNGLRLVKLDTPGQYARESDAMKHSMRGYEPTTESPDALHPDWAPPDEIFGSNQQRKIYGVNGRGWEDIKSGDTEALSLRDKYNNPYASLELNNTAGDPHEFYNLNKEAIDGHPELKELEEDISSNIPSDNEYMSMMTAYMNDFGVPRKNTPSQAIHQIKGVNNMKVDPAYWPQLQQFVKSKDWDYVNDLSNIGMVRHNQLYHASRDFDPLFIEKNPIYTREEAIKSMQSTYNLPEEEAAKQVDDILSRDINL